MSVPRFLLTGFLSAAIMSNAHAENPELTPHIAAIREVVARGGKQAEAAQAVVGLRGAKPADLPQLLSGMDGANPLAENWLRGAAEAVAAKGKPPIAELESFMADRKHSPRARRLAYELILAVDPTAEKRLIPGLLSDTSLELRRDAVAFAVSQAAATQGDEALKLYRTALSSARSIEQIKSISKTLRDLKQTVDLPSHMGYLQTWRVVGPFENAGDKGYDAVYPPESLLDYEAVLPGRMGPVKWIAHTGEDDFGVIDLTKVLDKHKGAVAYAAGEFISAEQREAELRVGCINAHKVWVNGESVGMNHVYHAGMEIDQYTFPVRLKAGKNVILLKICQNEQTEPWAQRWQFQARICDTIGTAILSTDRPEVKK